MKRRENMIIEERVEILLSEMSLDEKIGQLKVKWLMPWEHIFNIFRAVPQDRREKLMDFMFLRSGALERFSGEREEYRHAEHNFALIPA